MKWVELHTAIEGKSVPRNTELLFHQIAFDSRSIKDGTGVLFFAIKGDQHDGHDYIRNLYDLGTRNFVIEREITFSEFHGANFLVVPDGIKAMQQLAAYHRNQFEIPVIGITGSNGKTTIKEWLGVMLGIGHSLVKNPKSFNSQIGVPFSVWNLTSKHDLGIFEAGISQPGEMSNLEPIIRPTIGIFTNIGTAHDQGFETRDQKIREKALLFRNSSQIICCKDHERVFRHLNNQYTGKVITWSLSDQEATLKYNLAGNQLDVVYAAKTYILKLPFTFRIWVENVLNAITTAILLGLTEAEIQQGLDHLKPVKMRLEIKKGMNDCYLIDDSYNNDLQALEIALDFMKHQRQKEKKTVILSDLLQSGFSSEVLYQNVNHLLKTHQVDQVIGVGPEITKHKNLFDVPIDLYPNTETLIDHLPVFNHEMLLIKGARPFALERVTSLLQDKSHRTILELNFEALSHNLRQYRQLLSPGVKVMGMVKAFAYGAGNLEIANFLQFQKIDYLGVAYADEAIALRKNGIHLPIMVMNPELDSLPLLCVHDVEPEIFSFKGLEALIRLEKMPSIHLKIETGMNRLGFTPDQLEDLLTFLSGNPKIRVAGIFTHFSSADDPEEDDFTSEQAREFEEAFTKLSETLGYTPIRHAVNSAGVIRWPRYHFDMVRLGIGLHGFDSTDTLHLRPTGKLTSKISQVRDIKKGESVGYNRSGIAKKDMKIAIIPIGYADGYSRVFGNGAAYMNINGLRAATIGNICMDMAMIDVTGIPCEEGDDVVVFGASPTISDLAGWANTIPYEILTNISERVKRVFYSE